MVNSGNRDLPQKFDTMFVTLFVVSFVGLCAAAPRHNFDEKLTGECSYEELSKCDLNIALFVNGKIPVTPEEVKTNCELQSKSIECYSAFGHKCISGIEKGLFLVLLDAFKDEIDTRCTPGSDVFKSYAKHAECLSKTLETKKCLRQGVKALNWINTDVEVKDQIKATCCVYPDVKDCLRKAIVPSCGKEASAVAEGMFDKYFNELLDVACKKHRKAGCANVPKAPKGLPDNGEVLHFVNPLATIAHVATKYP